MLIAMLASPPSAPPAPLASVGMPGPDDDGDEEGGLGTAPGGAPGDEASELAWAEGLASWVTRPAPSRAEGRPAVDDSEHGQPPLVMLNSSLPAAQPPGRGRTAAAP